MKENYLFWWKHDWMAWVRLKGKWIKNAGKLGIDEVTTNHWGNIVNICIFLLATHITSCGS